MRPQNAKMLCYTRFKLSISTATVAAAKIDGVVGGHFATLINTTCELAKGLVHDWTGTWSTSNEHTRAEQLDRGLIVCRELQKSLKSLSEIYEQRRTYYKQAKRAKLALEQSSASPDTTETFKSESPGHSQALFLSSSDNQAQSGAMVEKKEVKEEPLDDVMFNSTYQSAGPSQFDSKDDKAFFDEAHDQHSSTNFQTYDEIEYDETKPPLMESQPPAVPKDEDLFEDVEPMVDLFCPTTGDARARDEEEERVEWRNEKFLHYPIEQYGHYEMRLEPTIRDQVFNPSNVLEIPFHVTPKRCYLCAQMAYHYLLAPFDPSRRAAFLESMILTKTREEEEKMSNLKTTTRAHFCREHITTGSNLPQNLPSHAKKRRTQEFMKKILSIKNSKMEGNNADATPSSSTSPPSGQAPNTGNGLPSNTIFSVTSTSLDTPADAPSTSTAKPSSVLVGENSTSNSPQTSALAKRYARVCDICKQLSYPFRFSPSDKTVARKFFADLINITENQRICIRQYLTSNTRIVVCSRHIEPNSKWTTGVAPGIASATRYTIRAPDPPGSSQNAPLPVRAMVVLAPSDQHPSSSANGASDNTR